MKKAIYISLFLCCCIGIISAQEDSLDFDRIKVSDIDQIDTDGTQEVEKLRFGAEIGMSYIFSSKGFQGSAISFSPYANYKLTKKLYATAGVSLLHGNVMMMNSNELVGIQSVPLNSMLIYAGGRYMVNNKLALSGTVYKNVLDVPHPNRVTYKNDYEYQGISLGFNYKLTPNISFGAQIQYNSPENPWYSGLYQPGRNSYYNNLYPVIW